MSLSTVIFVLLPLFLIPAIVLPSNRMKVYFISSFFAAIPVMVLVLVCLLYSENRILLSFGSIFSPIFQAFFIDGMTSLEKAQVSLFFVSLVLYFILYIISYAIQKVFVLGSNVTIKIGPNPIGHFFYAVFFVLFTFGALAMFLIGIRQILPLPDGFLSGFFQWLFPLEA